MRQGDLHLRPLDPVADRSAVRAVLDAVEDYYRLWLGRPADDTDVQDFFTSAPPGCDAAGSDRLGLFVGGHLCGLAELAYGYPSQGDAYLGLMLLAPHLRGQGIGAWALGQVEQRARARGARQMFLAVLQANPRGAKFWADQGFTPTGFFRDMTENGITHRVARLVKPLAPVD